MVQFFINRVRGWWALALVAASVGYGALIIVGLPFWGRLQAAQGGAEIQTQFGYGAVDAAAALERIVTAGASADAFAFYTLDVGNALLYGSGIAAMMAFGLRQFRIEQTFARWLVLLPLLSGAADLVENACLAALLANAPGIPSVLGDAAGAATAVKFAAGFPAQIIGLLLALGGLGAWAWRTLTRKPA